MDHAWIWSKDATLCALQHVMGNRATIKVQVFVSKSVKEFLDALDASLSVTKLVSSLLVGSHVNNDGWIEVYFGKGQKTDTIFDEMIWLFKVDNKVFLIPTSLHTSVTLFVKFRIVGCQSGCVSEMFKVLKRVMGGVVQVVGSKFFYEVFAVGKHGGFISFWYGFEVYLFMEIKKVVDLVTFFQTRVAAQPFEFSFIDGMKVFDAQWIKWVFMDRYIGDTRFNYGLNHGDLGKKIGKHSTLLIRLESRHQTRFVKHTVKNMTQLVDLAVGCAEFKQKLPSYDDFLATHEFLFHRRKGNVTIAEYVDSFDWQFQQNGTFMECYGIWYDYTMLVLVKLIDLSKSWEKQRFMYHFYFDVGLGLIEFTDFTDDELFIFVTV